MLSRAYQPSVCTASPNWCHTQYQSDPSELYCYKSPNIAALFSTLNALYNETKKTNAGKVMTISGTDKKAESK
jgi:hypothetical protein